MMHPMGRHSADRKILQLDSTYKSIHPDCRRHNADRKVMLYTGLAYAVMAAWGIFTQNTAGTQPLVASTVIGAASNYYKLQQIFPSGSSESGGTSGATHAVL
jgi:hypothetical protein